MKGRGILVALAAAAVTVGITASQALGATTWTVDKTTGNDGTCGTTHICKTIQAAVNLASAGDTIIVHKGQFNENVLVDKKLTLKGAARPGLAAACNATTAASATLDTIVNGTGGAYAFDIEADDVTLTGFVIQNTSPSSWGVVVDLSTQDAAFSGLTVTKNVFEVKGTGGHDSDGLFLSSNGTDPTLVQANCFRLNDEDAIFSGWGGLDTFKNAKVLSNKFLKNYYGDMIFVDPDQQDISVTGNISTGGGYFFRVNSLSSFTVSGNIAKSHDTSPTSKHAVVFIGGSSTAGTIQGNIFLNGTEFGLRFDQIDTGDRNTSIQVRGNIITGFGDNPIEVEMSSLDDSTFTGNIAKTTTGDKAIFVDTDNNNNTFRGNIFIGMNWGCYDDSSGTGTSGTANTWGDSNIGKPHNSPFDICFPHK